MIIRTKLICICLILVFTGCEENAKKLKDKSEDLLQKTKGITSGITERGKDIINSAQDTECDLEWKIIIDHVESKGLKISELSTLYIEKKWDEARIWVESIDGASTKVAFRTVGEVLFLEEIEGIDKCSIKIDVMMSKEDIDPIRKKTLEVMKVYVNGKGGMKSSEVLVTLAIVALICSGADINIHAVDQTGRIAFELLLALKQSLKEGHSNKRNFHNENKLSLDEIFQKMKDEKDNKANSADAKKPRG